MIGIGSGSVSESNPESNVGENAEECYLIHPPTLMDACTVVSASFFLLPLDYRLYIISTC